jgi:hypothetical protein
MCRIGRHDGVMVEAHVLDGEEETMSHLQPHTAEGSMETSDDGGPNWWHRDHPVFTPLTGFFSGLAFTLVVPGLFAALLEAFFPQRTVTDLFPFGAALLIVPLVLIAREHTRRFGLYFLLGMVATALVVVGVASVALWLLTR